MKPPPIVSPGSLPATDRDAIEVLLASANRIVGIDAGIRMSIVAAAATPPRTPADSRAAVRRPHPADGEPAVHPRASLDRAEQPLDETLIQGNVSVVQWSDGFATFSARRAPDRFAVRFDRAMKSLVAATQGLGVALESATVAGTHIADGRQRPVFGLDAAQSALQARDAGGPVG